LVTSRVNDLDQILTAFEEVLTLERELGTRTVTCDRALLVPMRSAPASPPPSAASGGPRSGAAESARISDSTSQISDFKVPSPDSKGQSSDSKVPSPDSKGQRPTDIAFIADVVPVGAAAELLEKMIAAMGYELSEVTIVEAPSAAQTPPVARVYVVLGSDARKLFMPQIRAARGLWTEVNGVPTVVTNSPARMLRFFANDPARLREAKQQVWTDLKSVLFRLGKRATR